MSRTLALVFALAAAGCSDAAPDASDPAVHQLATNWLLCPPGSECPDLAACKFLHEQQCLERPDCEPIYDATSSTTTTTFVGCADAAGPSCAGPGEPCATTECCAGLFCCSPPLVEGDKTCVAGACPL
jgi:hypothetical protein